MYLIFTDILPKLITETTKQKKLIKLRKIFNIRKLFICKNKIINIYLHQNILRVSSVFFFKPYVTK